MTFYPCSDGYVYLHVLMKSHMRRFAKAVDLQGILNCSNSDFHDILDDPSRHLRLDLALLFRNSLKKQFQRRTVEQWRSLAERHDLIIEPVSHSPVSTRNPLPVDWGIADNLPIGSASNWSPSIRAIDLSQVVAGPLCALLLEHADYDVVRIQLPGSRRQHFHQSLDQLLTPLKRPAIELDLFCPHSKRQLSELVDSFQPNWILGNLRDKAMQRIKELDSWRLSREQIYWANIQAFADPNKAGFEQSLQAYHGFTSSQIFGPRVVPLALHDILSAFCSAISIVFRSKFSASSSFTTVMSSLANVIHWNFAQQGAAESSQAVWIHSARRPHLIVPFSPVTIDDKVLPLFE